MSRNHKISQNFLKSPRVALMLVGHTNIKKKDFTLDIGAGSGVFTYALSKKSSKVLAIEIDKPTFKKLKLNTKNLKNVSLKNLDFLKFNLENIEKDYKICSNIPFHLSSQIIHKILFSNNKPKSAYFILQKQFAKKLIIDQNFNSALGVKIFPFFECKIKKPLRKTDYTPPPAVDTVFFEMKRRDNYLISENEVGDFSDFIDKMFAVPKFYKENCTKKFKDKKPSQLQHEDWLEIWRNFC